MPFQDYHRIGLNPSVWRSDATLHRRVRDGLTTLLSRFKPLRAYLVGAMMGHYYDENSSVDVLVQLPKDQIADALDEAIFLADRYVAGTEHPVHVVPVPSSVSPEVLQRKFGPLYDLKSWIWLGTNAGTKGELVNPDSMLRRINWRVFKGRKSLEDFSKRFWDLEKDIFGDLSYDDQLKVLEELGYRIRRLDHYVNKALVHQPQETWKKLNQLEQQLEASTSSGESTADVFRASTDLPETLKELVLQRLRYVDLKDTLQEVAAKLKEQRDLEISMKSLPINASVRTVPYHPVVVIRGGAEKLDQLEASLTARHPKKVSRSSRNALVIAAVSPKSLQQLSALAPKLGVTVEAEAAVEVEVKVPVVEKKAEPSLPSLTPGKWYYAESKEDVYPFLFPRKTTDSGWEVELLTASNAVPTKQVLNAEAIASFGLRPATEKDFKAHDLPVPGLQQLVQADAAPKKPMGQKPAPKRPGTKRLATPEGAAPLNRTGEQLTPLQELELKISDLRREYNSLASQEGLLTGSERRRKSELDMALDRLYLKKEQMKKAPPSRGVQAAAGVVTPDISALANFDLRGKTRVAGKADDGAGVWEYWTEKSAKMNSPKFYVERASDDVLKKITSALTKVSVEEVLDALAKLKSGKYGDSKLVKNLASILQAAASAQLTEMIAKDQAYSAESFQDDFMAKLMEETRRGLERGEVKSTAPEAKQQKQADYEFLDEPPHSPLASTVSKVVSDITQRVHDEVAKSSTRPIDYVIADIAYQILADLPVTAKVELADALGIAYVPYSPKVKITEATSFEDVFYAVVDLVRTQYEHDVAGEEEHLGAAEDGGQRTTLVDDFVQRGLVMGMDELKKQGKNAFLFNVNYDGLSRFTHNWADLALQELGSWDEDFPLTSEEYREVRNKLASGLEQKIRDEISIALFGSPEQ